MEAYGPNDRQVLRFLEQAATMSPDDAQAILRLGRPPDDPDLVRARRMLDRAALMAGRTDALEAARLAVRSSRGIPWFGRARRVYWRRPTARHADALLASQPLLVDAVGALVARDLLEPADFAVLYGPWAGVFGGPAGEIAP